MYNYRKIFEQAFKVAIYNPFLWFFAFFTALVGSSVANFYLFDNYTLSGQGMVYYFWQGLAEGGLFTKEGVSGLFLSLTSNPLFLFLFILAILIFLGLSVFMIWIGIISQSALISQSIAISKNKSVSFKEGFKLGIDRFWPILGLSVFLQLAIWVLFYIPDFFLLFDFPGSEIIALLSLFISLTAILIIYFVIKYALCTVVLKDRNIFEAIKNSWEIFKKNWIITIEVAFSIFLIYFFIGSFASWFFSTVILNFLVVFSGFKFGVFLIFILTISFFFILQIILTVFYWASWAIVFEILSDSKIKMTSFTRRIFDKLKF